MIPDFEQINERMEQASLNEFMPGFDKEQEWQQLATRLHPAKSRRLIPLWSLAAAILLLLAGGGLLTWFVSGSHGRQTIAATTPYKAIVPPAIPVLQAPDTSLSIKPAVVKNDTAGNRTKPGMDNAIAIKKHTHLHKTYYPVNNYTTRGLICNGTPCPIQICISQTVRCPNIDPAPVSSCSTLEPDQSGRLTYKAHDKIAKNCSLTINEIEITSIATGETILLNANSSPSTAQDVFSYITGQKKGDVLAGMFNSDCDHQSHKHVLKLNNSYGNLILQ